MYLNAETLRHRRNRVFLKNATFYWSISSLLGLLNLLGTDAVFGHQNSIISACYLSLVGLIGLVLTQRCKALMARNPLWNPVRWHIFTVALNGILWAMTARLGGFNMTLALAHCALSAILLVSHGRLLIVSILPTILLPVPFLYWQQDPLLYSVYLPLVSLFAIMAYRGYQLSLSSMRNQLETERLISLQAQNQDELKAKIKKHTLQLDSVNRRLSNEIDLRKEINRALMLSEAQLSLAIKASSIGFWDWDIKNKRVFHSDAEQFFGHGDSTDEFALIDAIYEEDRQVIRKALYRHLRNHSSYYQVRYRIDLPNAGGVRWLEDTGQVTERDQLGRAMRMIGTRRDVTHDMQQQEELRLASSVFHNSSEGIFILDDQQRFLTCNRAFCNTFLCQKGELIGQPLFQIIHTEQAHQISRGVVNNDRWNGNIIVTRSRQRLPMSMTLTAIRREDNSIANYLGFCHDAFSQQKTVNAVSDLHTCDELTGLFNRSYFQQVLKQFQEHRPLARNRYAVAVLNLDDFEAIKSRISDSECDQLIKDLAVRLSNFSDPVRQVARISEYEFALVLEYEEDAQLLDKTLSRLVQEVARPIMSVEGSVVLNASLGATIVRQSNLFQLLNEACSAMKAAKQLGGNGVQYFNETSLAHSMDRQQLESDLRYAVINNQFSLDYKPKLNLISDEIDSVEVCVRWIHPEHGVIDPPDFLPVAEDLGLVMNICEQVIDHACRDMAAWRDSGIGQTTVSINLSYHQSLPAELYSMLKNTIEKYSLTAHYLELEFSESLLMLDVDYSVDYLDRLSSLGVGVAIDDFGIGYSSLAYLKRLPIDALKIDQHFIADTKEGQMSPVIEAIMAMADSLGLKVVAEGVESEAQLKYLKHLGCHYVQGLVVSDALPSPQVLSLIRDSKLRTLSQLNSSVH
ncbi:putative bifunctional diguanylate cyclase/phosphodiesterase [Reinekea thalattae]|uniref:EAL domain-containing protein n=1 Tax=Reinekea thalattae TaxID=2593301 RepID=A0A5C8ZBP8_9GAMM|nr:EAL domain-containing protein [Reinekea thalattae]TXR54618.1 EAL domain-containing protein [Reinekea thalattae]